MGCIVQTIKNKKATDQNHDTMVQTNIRSKSQIPLNSIQKMGNGNELNLQKIIQKSVAGVSLNSFRTINFISVGNSQNTLQKRQTSSTMTSRQIFLQDYQRIKDEYDGKYKQLICNLGQVKFNVENSQILKNYLINLKLLAKVEDQLGYHQKSLRSYKKYLEITKSMGFSKDSQEIVLAQKDVAWLEFKKGNSLKIWSILQSCLHRLGKEKQGLAYAQILACQGQLKFIDKKYSQALVLYERVYEIENNYATESLAISNTLNKLGLIHYHLKDYQHAIFLYENGLGITKRLKGENSMEYAKILGNLGNIHFERGHYTKAKQVYDECLSICRDNNQIKSNLYTNSLLCAGNACYKQSNFEGALKYYEKVGLHQKQAKSKCMLQNLNKIAKCHQKLGNKPNYSRAKVEYYQQSIKRMQTC